RVAVLLRPFLLLFVLLVTVLLAFLLVALREERGLHVRAQRHGEQDLRPGVDEARVELAVRRDERPAAREVEPVALAVERRSAVGEHARGHLVLRLRLELVEPDRGERLVLVPPGEGEPA